MRRDTWTALFGDVGTIAGDCPCGCGGTCGCGPAPPLGDIVCSAAEYTAAANAVGDMNRIFGAADSITQGRYKSTVNSLLSSWNTYTNDYEAHWYNKNPVYLCNFKTLGVQAARLAAQIAAESNQAPPPIAPELQQPKPLTDTIGKVVVELGAVAGVAYLGAEALKAIVFARQPPPRRRSSS